MSTRVYVAKPAKVHADQFMTAVTPWDPAVCTHAAPIGICLTEPLFPDWQPHVHGDGRIWEVHDTDWITRPFHAPEGYPEVLTHAHFADLYGTQPAEGEST